MSQTTSSIRRAEGREALALRPVTIETGAMKFAEGSALIAVGDTRVMVSASVESRVPPFLSDSGRGWVTAEYAMLPRATQTRSRREVSRGRPSGRSAEIQRLIGRSLRAVFDFEALGERTITLDCDVLQADGGTRTASITAAYVAAAEACALELLRGDLSRWPIRDEVAAVSVGLVDDQVLLDLDASEDQGAQVDLNVVATGSGRLVEVQGTGEQRSFAREELDHLLDAALAGISELVAAQRACLATILEEVASLRQGAPRRKAPAKDEKDLWR